MRRDEAIAKLKAQTEKVRFLGAAALYLYGSTARDEAGPDSDIDVFVDFASERGYTLLDLGGIKSLLEEELDEKVDVSAKDALNPKMKESIFLDAVRIFDTRMPRRDPGIPLMCSLNAIARINSSTRHLDFDHFCADELVYRAAERNMEIISEASQRLPRDVKADRPDVPWTRIAGVSSVLRHDYTDLAPRLIWGMIRQDLPDLEHALQRMRVDLGH